VATAPGHVNVVSRLRAPEAPESLTDDDPGARMLSRAYNCGFSANPLRRGALLTDPEIFETLAVPRVGSQPPSIAGNFSNLDDTEAGLREILAASFAHVELEAVGSIAIFAAAAPRARSSKPSDTC
jgi:hypothetical protein